jgi:hypothetical protein
LSQSSVCCKVMCVTELDMSVPYGYETGSATLREKHVLKLRFEVLTEQLMKCGVLGKEAVLRVASILFLMFRRNLLSRSSLRSKAATSSKTLVTYYQ